MKRYELDESYGSPEMIESPVIGHWVKWEDVLPLVTALNGLTNESQGFVNMADPANHGHTNIQVMSHWIKTAREALKAAGVE